MSATGVHEVQLDRNGLEVLDEQECLRLLAGHVVGRIGTTAAALPTILPVNYTLVGGRIVFRTGRGTKLQRALDHDVVAFEVDDLDVEAHSGWSVVAVGVARVVADPELLALLDQAGIAHWVPGSDGCYVEIEPTTISGRRLVPVHRATGGGLPLVHLEPGQRQRSRPSGPEWGRGDPGVPPRRP
ncbi:MAG: pyridoxamine 5'-phosphate oxidase family protein [Acidimicrobiia bacterium]